MGDLVNWEGYTTCHRGGEYFFLVVTLRLWRRRI
jgi:hypothetical protein